MRIEFNDEQMRAIVAESLFDKMTEETKKALIAGAMEKLMAPEQVSDGFRGQKDGEQSVLQAAFNTAICMQAQKVAHEIAAEEKTKEVMRALAREALDKFMDEKFREAAVRSIAEGIMAAFTNQRGY